jgi:hypothetical protein
MQASGSGRHRVKRLVRRNWRDVAEGAARAAVDAVRQAEAEALASHGLVNRAIGPRARRRAPRRHRGSVAVRSVNLDRQSRCQDCGVDATKSGDCTIRYGPQPGSPPTLACSVWPISPSASAARYASTISPACQHAPRRRGPLYPNLGGGAGSADHADRPVCSLHTIDELPQLINVLRGDMSIVLVRQTGAVGAIRGRAPVG